MDTKALKIFFISFCFIVEVAAMAQETHPVLASYLKSCGVLSVTPLAGGKSYDHLFRLKTEKNTWVLRILNLKRSLEKRHLICRATYLIGERGLGPKVIWYDQSYQFLITEFVEGKHLTPEDIQDPLVFKKLVFLIRQAHEVLSQVSSSLKPYFLKDRVLQRLKEVSPYLSDLKSIVPLKREIESIALVKPYHFSHGDIKGSNILKTSTSLFLIDWGEVGLSSLYDDLGSLSFHFSLRPDQEENLLNLYFGHSLKEKTFKNLRLHRWLAELHHCLWEMREKKEKLQQPT
jgi:thiamine kinase-like enzyme